MQKTENAFVKDLRVVRGECAKWKESLQKTGPAGAEAASSGGGDPVPGGDDPGNAGGDLPVEEQPWRVRAQALRNEIGVVAAQKSRTWTGLALLPDNVAATVPLVESVAVAKKG